MSYMEGHTVTSETFSTIRTVLLGLTGLACLGYALAALVMGRPDPVGWYWPASIGSMAGLLIALAALAAGRAKAGQATDDLYHEVNGRAQRQAYWLSMLVFAVLAVSAAQGWVAHRTAMAALGCLMGAAYLLLFVWHDLRLR